MKKKYGLFKVLAVLLLIIFVLSFFLKGRQEAISYIALGDLLFNYIQSFRHFFDTAIFLLVVGGFYGLLNRIPAYQKMVNNMANKMSGNSKLFIIITTIVFALVSSLTGLNVLLFIFIPMVISIILLVGYDKLVALTATIGGTLVGVLGGVFLTFKDGTGYSASDFINFDKLSGLDGIWVTLIPKIILFVVAVGLLVFFLINYIKKLEKGKVNYNLSNNDNLFVEVKDRNGKKTVVDNKKVKVWPLIVVLSILVILLILGYLPWMELFGLDIFNDFHTWLTGLKIGDYAVFPSLIFTSISAFGTWGTLGNYVMAIILMIFFGAILVLVYRIKFEDAMDGFIYGIKKMIPATLIVMLAYSVLITAYSHGFMEVLIDNASTKFGDNVLIHSLIVMAGSLVNVDLFYSAAGIFYPVVMSLGSDANLSVYSVMFQSLFGLVQFVGPTSILLIVGLTYLEVPYKSWLKYIWRFVVALFIVILITLMVLYLI